MDGAPVSYDSALDFKMFASLFITSSKSIGSAGFFFNA